MLEIAQNRSSLVILTGGLGPTEDDLTKQTLAQFLGRDLTFDPQAQAKLDDFLLTDQTMLELQIMNARLKLFKVQLHYQTKQG